MYHILADADGKGYSAVTNLILACRIEYFKMKHW